MEFNEINKIVNKLNEECSKYSLNDLSEEEINEAIHLDTLLTKPIKYLTGKKITLYHASDIKDPNNRVYPLHKSVGNKLSGRDFVSWWAEDVNGSLGLYFMWFVKNSKYTHNKIGLDDARDHLTFGLNNDKHQYLDKDYYERHKSSFEKFRVYLYEHTFKYRDLYRGQEYNVNEWTCDKVVECSVKELKIKDLFDLDVVLLVDKETFAEKKDLWDKFKSTGAAGIGDSKASRDWIYYDYAKLKEMEKYIGARNNPKYHTSSGEIKIPKDIPEEEILRESELSDDLTNLFGDAFEEPEFLNESFFTKEDLEVNVEDFPDKNKILYITGLSGGGKSTLAKELSKKYNCANIELDLFWSAAKWTKEEFIDRLKDKTKFSTGDPEIDNIVIEYLEKLPESDFKYRKSPNEQSQELLDHVIKIIKDFILYFEKLNKIAILEGSWLVHLGPDFFEGKSIIIKGTGIAKSNARAIKRYWNKGHDLKSNIRILFQRIKLTIFPNKYYKGLYNDYDNLRMALSESEFSDDLEAIYGDLPEVERIKDVLHELKDVRYGFVNKETGEEMLDREWIHHCDNLGKYYSVETDPEKTIKSKLGICQDQSLAFKYLMNKMHPDMDVELYALIKGRFGHCVPTFSDNGNYYYLENAWDKERGCHGPFESKEELKEYLDFIYHKNHDEDNDDAVQVISYDDYLKGRTLNESYIQIELKEN